MLLVQHRQEIAVLAAVTALLLHHNAMNTWTECNIVSTGEREMAVLSVVIAVLFNLSITV